MNQYLQGFRNLAGNFKIFLSIIYRHAEFISASHQKLPPFRGKVAYVALAE
ncbi:MULTISPECIES: hypothetical protein [Mesonia]|uniref:hypothetical protein n=1 Tax=Mesonia TaxID=232115 RepID=UPI00188A5FF5|nr:MULTISPECIES: hypothetical protein [Mesonia]